MPAAGVLRVDVIAGTKQFEQGMARATKQVNQLGKSSTRHAGSQGKFNQRMVEGSRAIDDIAAGFATAGFSANGFALALRGAQNNVTTMLAVTSPLAAAIAGVAFAAGSILVKRFAASGKEAEKLTEKLDKMTEALERLASAKRSQAGLPALGQPFAFGDDASIQNARKRLGGLQKQAARLRETIRKEKDFQEKEAALPPGLRTLSRFGGFIASAGGLNPKAEGVRAAAAATALARITPEIDALAKSIRSIDDSSKAIKAQQKESSREAFRAGIQRLQSATLNNASFLRGISLVSLAQSPALEGLRRFRVPSLVGGTASQGAKSVSAITDRFAQAVSTRSAGAKAANERGRFAFRGQAAAQETAKNTGRLIELLKTNTEAIRNNIIQVLAPVG